MSSAHRSPNVVYVLPVMMAWSFIADTAVAAIHASIFSTRCNIYISRLCYDVSSVCLKFVHCGYRVQWIPDIFACLDRWMSLLLTDSASPGSSDGMMPGFLVEEGVIVVISLILLTESLDRKHVTVCLSTMLTFL